jgi:pimeloyl-ACP methyl ester carboxylesterase
MVRSANAHYTAFLATVVATVFAGCMPIKVWEVHPEPASRAVQNILGEKPLGRPDARPKATVGAQTPTVLDPALVTALSAFDDARRLEFWSRDEAARRYFAAMAFAYELMVQNLAGSSETAVDPQRSAARSIYNRSLERFLRLAGDRRFLPNESWRANLAQAGISIAIRRDGAVWSPERFDELRFASDFVVRGMPHFYGSDGVGVPLIAVRRPTLAELDNRQGPDRFYPYWEVYPVTAVLRFDLPRIDRGRASLELHDTLRATHADLGGATVDLAADLTTPVAYHFARGKLGILEKTSLFNPGKVTRQSGLHMLHPYERGKIPVVLIHGLASSAKAWGRVVNELRGDPELRSRYQFWIFMYPTGDPFIKSAAELRHSLTEARQTVDQNNNDPAFDHMVLIGHSMGGLIVKMAITESRDDLWHLISRQPFDRLVADPDDRAMFRQAFFFEPLPFVKRAVFIATPHRGSKLGNQFIGRLGDSLIRLPDPLLQAHDRLLAQNGVEFFTQLFPAGVPSSIDVLALDNPYLTTLDQLPVAPWVTAHSIIGKVGDGPLEASTDGVVPYSSSHLPWTVSERVVPRNHACQDSPEAIEELSRILKVHAVGLPPGS